MVGGRAGRRGWESATPCRGGTRPALRMSTFLYFSVNQLSNKADAEYFWVMDYEEKKKSLRLFDVTSVKMQCSRSQG